VITHDCEMCTGRVEGADLAAFGDAYIAHLREVHPEMPFPDTAIRNYAEATQRATGRTDRLDSLAGTVEVHRVTEDRIADWLTFFDRDAFSDNFAWASCYCSEPTRLADPARADETPPWQQARSEMEDWLRSGRAAGYLAYVDGRAAGWCNASPKANVRWRSGDDTADEGVIAISCFVVAPPYRGHGLARSLLQEVLRDAPARGATAIEGYPRNAAEGPGANYHGPLSLYLEAGFEIVEEREAVKVVRKPVSG
jgi:GNAT superfamily N-acetyltransferase